MNKKIQILHLEDSVRDSELIHSLIETGGIVHNYFLADSEKDFMHILETENIDIILCDYKLPDYNGNEALRVVKDQYSDIPFIFISGTMGEDAAIHAMLDGAADYVLKNKLERLVPAINRALRERQIERKRKLAEKALKETQKMLVEAQKLAHLGVWDWNANTDLVTWTEELYQIAGLDPKLPAPSFAKHSAMYAPQSRQLLKTAEEKAMKTGEPYQLELELLRPDGKVRNVNTFGGAKVDEKGKIYGLYGTVQDITEHKQAEEALVKSEEKYRRIFENVQDVYYEVKIDGTILEVSPSIEILSKGQYHSADLIGKVMFDFYSDPQERQALLKALEERGAVMDFIVSLNNRDGSSIPCSISSKICFDAQGRPEKIIGSMRDITDRMHVSQALKYAKEKAEASDKLKTLFLNNISHEVRTPLNGILGFAEIISHDDLSEKDRVDSLSMLSESSDRLLNTITNYIDISLITSGSLSVDKKDFFPRQVLKKIFDQYKKKCSEGRVELFLDIPNQTENLLVNSDPEIFRTILSHLVNNAIKFTEKGSIYFGYKINGGELEVFVKDSGIGIGKESLGCVFDHFVKEDHGLSKLFEGSGLGLSIAKGMTALIGGNIRVESEAGLGSYFSFSIPLTKESKVVPSVPPKRQLPKINSGVTILVAEDDETNFFFLKAILTRETGARVLHASNGREAIDLFKANQDIILVLMDIKMPLMDGLEATRQIKSIKKEVPVIAITGYAMSGDEHRMLAAGCDGYLSKPISKRSLVEKMAEYVIL